MDSIKLFPNPPRHYNLFVQENALPPPDINSLNKISSFMSFGIEYKMKELNLPTYSVDSAFLKMYDQKTIENKSIPNINIDFTSNNFENLNLFEAIKNEINFIKKCYIGVLDDISNLEDFELNSCLSRRGGVSKFGRFYKNTLFIIWFSSSIC